MRADHGVVGSDGSPRNVHGYTVETRRDRRSGPCETKHRDGSTEGTADPGTFQVDGKWLSLFALVNELKRVRGSRRSMYFCP